MLASLSLASLLLAGAGTGLPARRARRIAVTLGWGVGGESPQKRSGSVWCKTIDLEAFASCIAFVVHDEAVNGPAMEPPAERAVAIAS